MNGPELPSPVGRRQPLKILKQPQALLHGHAWPFGTLVAGTSPSDYFFSLNATSLSVAHSDSGASAIPEPSTHAALFGAAMFGFVLRQRLASKPDSGYHPREDKSPKTATPAVGNHSRGFKIG